MPILDVQVIGSVPEEIRRGLAQRIADEVGRVFESGSQETWVTLHFIPADAYSENSGGPPAGVQPVIVSVIQTRPPRGQALREQVARLTRVIADACRRPAENVHLIYEPAAKGGVAFGGNIVE